MLGTLWASNKKGHFGYSHIGHAVENGPTERGYNPSKALKRCLAKITHKKYKKNELTW